MKNRLVYGWGVNDIDYNVTKSAVVGGKSKTVWRCPYHVKWVSILARCFCPKYQERQPTYKGCTVTDEWKYLSNFIKWVDSQPNKDWMDCEIDKDFLFQGNKHYSPDTVVFIPKKVNLFIMDSGNNRGAFMLGVSYYPRNKKNPYRSECKNPFIKGKKYIGVYPSELEAHLAWQAKKHGYACQIADIQANERVAKALRERYAPDKDWTNR